MGIVSAAAQLAFLLVLQSGRGHHQGQAALNAQFDGRFGPRGQREIHDHVGVRLQCGCQWNAQRGHSGQRPHILAQLGMAGAFQRRHDLQFGVRAPQGDQSPAHAPGGSVNDDACLGHGQLCCSTAWIIWSKSLGTTIARLANAARSTPRLPNTFWKCSWSDV